MQKQILLLTLLMALCTQSFSQITFEKGYFITKSNQKTECLIKNREWKNNPTMFEYKLSEGATIQEIAIEKVKEFGINGISKYICATVKMDKSSDDITNLTSDKNPIFQEENLLLKVLVEGKASLFMYEKGKLIRFFYKKSDSVITQLVYKRYLTNTHIEQNALFKSQLFTDLKCQGITLNDLEHINYKKEDLEKFFVRYNECTNSEHISYERKVKRDMFNLSVRPGVNFSSLAVKNDVFSFMNTDFGNKLNFRFGIEAEFVLPYNKNKWSLIAEPTYQYFHSEKTTYTDAVAGGIMISKVDYQSIEIPVGFRHYFFLNKQSKIFADLSYFFDFGINSKMKFSTPDNSRVMLLDINSRRNFGLGLGYKFKDKYSISMRYQLSREILADYFELQWRSHYNTLSVMLGYTLF